MNRSIALFASIVVFFLISGNATAQQPTVKRAAYFDKTPPLREMELVVPGPRDRSWKDGIIRNEDSDRKRNDNPAPLPAGADPVWQQHFGFRDNANIIANFEGVPNLNSVYPPDTDGDVGPDHYFQMINLSFQIFDKEGNSLYGPADNRTLWNGFIGPWTATNDGDPILLYDEVADRWVATQFAINTPDGTFWELVAVSETGDPLGAYYRYAFQFPVFNDYPKLGVWPDGYYFSFNMFGGDYRRAAVCALDRDAMLAGDPDARMILFDLPEGSEPWSLLPTDFDGTPPPPGTPNYFAYGLDDAFGAGDQIVIYEFKADWEDPLNSTFLEVARLETEPFNSFFCFANLGACLPQPENAPLLEALSDRLMFRLQYRNFGDYAAMVTNHTVNVDGEGHAGIRWYEFRDNLDGNGWYIYQQGTYAPDGLDRWMGSIAMDGRGYIALGYSVVSETVYPSIRYTGRSPNDPLGEMTFYEEEIIAGTGVQTGSVGRWGDYSMMSVDPVDDTTFWFTTEYVQYSGQVRWQTRIAGFRMTEDKIAPSPVTDLSAAANTTNSITLQWTATGNDGDEGTAFLYDIRHSFTPIDEDNFDAAVPVPNTPSPSVAGTAEVFTINGLEFDRQYYIAMKVRDRQFNFSGLSNLSQAVTPGAPVIATQSDLLVQKMFPGSAGSRGYTLSNTGASDIYFRVQKDTLSVARNARKLGDYADRTRVADAADGPAFDLLLGEFLESASRGAGDVLAEYGNANTAITGLVWAGGILFLTDMQKNFLLRYDTALQALVDTVVIHASPFSMTWDGEFLWIGDKTGNVFAYHTDGTPAGYSFSCPKASYSSLAWDGQYFLTNYIMDQNPVISRLDETGAVVSSFKVSINKMNIWQLAWVPEHFSGQLWFTNNSGVIGQILVEEGVSQWVQQFAAPAPSAYGLAHDRSDLWYGKLGGVIYRIDDGIDEVNWLQINPLAGTIPAQSQQALDLWFDGREFAEGTYHANMIFLSNDPVRPEIRVPVDMLLTGIDIGPDTSFCGHLSITLDAGEGFAGYLWLDGSTGQTLVADASQFSFGETLIWVEVTDIGGVVNRDSILVNFIDCTSIVEFSSGLKVIIFPNPNRGEFTVRAEGLKEKLDISISDLSGKTVFRREMTTPQMNIDLTGQPRGQYLLRVSTKEGMKVERVMTY